MAGWNRTLSVCWLFAMVACGGNAKSGATTSGSSSSFAGQSGGGSGGVAGAPAGGVSRGGGPTTAGSGGRTDPFVDPLCPTIEPPPGIYECDPLGSADSQCGPGFGCYPYVQHPFGDGCDAESYGALCLPAGSGGQGALCGDGTDDCAPGYICVIGAHAGKRCAKLCSFAGGDECPLGMICGDTDIEGYGVCD